MWTRDDELEEYGEEVHDPCLHEGPHKPVEKYWYAAKSVLEMHKGLLRPHLSRLLSPLDSHAHTWPLLRPCLLRACRAIRLAAPRPAD